MNKLIKEKDLSLLGPHLQWWFDNETAICKFLGVLIISIVIGFGIGTILLK